MTTAEAWAAQAAKELKGRPLTELLWQTPEGIAVKPLYTAADLEGMEAGLPGLAPFRRGARATMYAGRPWTLRQYAGFSTAEETNTFTRANLAAGQTGMSVAFDLPTHRGYDSDHPLVAGDVGKAGVAIDSVEDMKILFDGIALDRLSVSMTMNGAVLPILAMFIVAAEEQGVTPAQLSGTIQNDILKEFMVRNTYIYPPAASLRITADVIEYAARQMPKFHSISISGYHMQEAGATAVQELAFTLADGKAYVRAALARGLGIDDFAPQLSFFFGVGMNFFMEIAKLRAARVLWCEIMQGLGARKAESLILRTHCQTSGVSLTGQEPMSNIVRTAYEAMAAVLGGTQSLHTNAFDEAIALPSEASARIARNTQLILQHETGVTHVADPLGGSYYVEALTHSLLVAARAIIADFDAKGGIANCLDEAKSAIEEAAARKQARIDKGEEVIVGVNRFEAETAEAVSYREIDNAAVLKTQGERLARVKAERDGARVEAALAALRDGAAGEANLLVLAIEAARARATLGEISAAIEMVHGRHSAAMAVVSGVYGDSFRGNNEFAALQGAVETYAKEAGGPPRLLIAKLGQDGHDRGAKVIASAFADIGFAVEMGTLFATPREVARRAAELGAQVVGISSLAAAHKTLVPALLTALREAGSTAQVVVGGVIPEPDQALLRQQGVAAIFGPGTNIPEAARAVLELLRG